VQKSDGYFTVAFALLIKNPWPFVAVQVSPLVDDWHKKGPAPQLLP
jgi:hypothetical protein